MNDFVLTAEVESLVQGYVEGQLTDLECARLRELLQVSPSLVKVILTSLRTDALIRHMVLQAASAEVEMAPRSGWIPSAKTAMHSLAPARNGRFTLVLAVAA